MKFESTNNFKQPFVSTLVSSNTNVNAEQFELPNLGLVTARYLNQVKLVIEQDSDIKLVPQLKESNLQQVLVELNQARTSVNQFDVSPNLLNLLQSQLPKTITRVGL